MSPDDAKRETRDLIGAFDLVHEAAMEGRIIAESDDMIDQEEAQLEAVNQVYDFLTNHHEQIEDKFRDDPEISGHLTPAELDLIGLREAPIDHPLNDAMLTTLELAAQQCTDEGITENLSAALDLAGAFWARRGAEICEETLSVSLNEGPA